VASRIAQGGESVDRRVDFRLVVQKKVGGLNAGSGKDAHQEKEQGKKQRDEKQRDVLVL
jgi:hypothetical protein